MQYLEFPPLLGPASTDVNPAEQPYRWVYKRFLGAGTFGQTYLVYEPRTGREAVVKLISLQSKPQHPDQIPSGIESDEGTGSEGQRARLRDLADREMETMAMVESHCAFPSLYDYAYKGNYGLIFMEYCDLGDFSKYMQLCNKQGRNLLREEEVKITFVQVLVALLHLHNRRMIHRDLKAANVLITSRGLVKVADFGLASVNRKPSTSCGTPEYMAPEQWVSPLNGYTSKVDMWAAGVLLYEMMAQQRPFDRKNGDVALGQNICKAKFRPIEDVPGVLEAYSEPLRRTIGHLLHRDPDKRPSASQLIRTPYFAAALQEFVNGLASACQAGQVPPQEVHMYYHCLWADGLLQGGAPQPAPISSEAAFAQQQQQQQQQLQQQAQQQHQYPASQGTTPKQTATDEAKKKRRKRRTSKDPDEAKTADVRLRGVSLEEAGDRSGPPVPAGLPRPEPTSTAAENTKPEPASGNEVEAPVEPEPNPNAVVPKSTDNAAATAPTNGRDDAEAGGMPPLSEEAPRSNESNAITAETIDAGDSKQAHDDDDDDGVESEEEEEEEEGDAGNPGSTDTAVVVAPSIAGSSAAGSHTPSVLLRHPTDRSPNGTAVDSTSSHLGDLRSIDAVQALEDAAARAIGALSSPSQSSDAVVKGATTRKTSSKRPPSPPPPVDLINESLPTFTPFLDRQREARDRRLAALARTVEVQERRERANAIIDPFFDGLKLLRMSLTIVCTTPTARRRTGPSSSSFLLGRPSRSEPGSYDRSSAPARAASVLDHTEAGGRPGVPPLSTPQPRDPAVDAAAVEPQSRLGRRLRAAQETDTAVAHDPSLSPSTGLRDSSAGAIATASVSGAPVRRLRELQHASHGREPPTVNAPPQQQPDLEPEQKPEQKQQQLQPGPQQQPVQAP